MQLGWPDNIQDGYLYGCNDIIKQQIFVNASLPRALLDNQNHTLQHLACREGDLEIVEQQQDHNADPNAQTSYGESSVHIASESGNPKVVQALQSHGGSLTYPSWEGWTPQHIACFAQNAEVVRVILEKGASVDCFTTSRETPLLLSLYGYARLTAENPAITKTLTRVVTALQDFGADPNEPSTQGVTPKLLAKEIPHLENIFANKRS